MTTTPPLSTQDFERLRSFGTPAIANAIERFDVRLRNEGFIHRAVHCRFPHLPPMLGYAVTGRIRSSNPPMRGGLYYDNMDFWRYVATLPAPRVVVVQDCDRAPGMGAFVGEIHAHIAGALDCVGCVTDGAVRDLEEVEAAKFHLFSGSLAVSHAYAHVVDFGAPVEIGGLTIRPGDLLHGDRHGVQTIPLDIAAALPAVAAEMRENERQLVELCRSPRFSLDALAATIQDMPDSGRRPARSALPARPGTEAP